MRYTTARLFALALILGVVAAVAGPVVIPPVLGFPSDTGQYRLLFVTSSTTAATSTDINFYNQFVTNAANSVPELAALHTQWTVAGSTDGVALVDNVGFSFVPMHRLDGLYVATSIINLNIGPLSNLITIDENGTAIASGRVWTGLTGNALGSATPTYGDPTSGCCSFGLSDGTAANTQQYHLYAISGVLQEAPEPSSIALMGLGAVALAGAYRRRVSRGYRRG